MNSLEIQGSIVTRLIYQQMIYGLKDRLGLESFATESIQLEESDDDFKVLYEFCGSDPLLYVKDLKSVLRQRYSDLFSETQQLISFITDRLDYLQETISKVESLKQQSEQRNTLENQKCNYFSILVDTILLKLQLLLVQYHDTITLALGEELENVKSILSGTIREYSTRIDELRQERYKYQLGIEFEMVVKEWRDLDRQVEVLESDIRRLSDS